MVDPDADPVELIDACRRMQELVHRHIAAEQIEAAGLWSGKDRIDDPYGIEWRTTERGAILELVRTMLADALSAADGTAGRM